MNPIRKFFEGFKGKPAPIPNKAARLVMATQGISILVAQTVILGSVLWQWGARGIGGLGGAAAGVLTNLRVFAQNIATFVGLGP